MKIGFCGTVSVGKITLVDALINTPEFANYKFFTERSKHLKSLGVPLDKESTAEGQTIFLSERVKELMNSHFIADRTVIDVIAFSNTGMLIENNTKAIFEEYAQLFISEYDYIFYLSPVGIPLEDNGIRTTDELFRNNIDKEIVKLIKKYKTKIKNLVMVEGTEKERINIILNTFKNG